MVCEICKKEEMWGVCAKCDRSVCESHIIRVDDMNSYFCSDCYAPAKDLIIQRDVLNKAISALLGGTIY